MIPRKGNVSRTRCAQGTGRAHRLATGSRPSRRLICCARVVGAGWPHRCWLSVTARSASGKPSARCSRTPANRVAGGIGRPLCSLHCRSRRTPVRSRRCGRSRSTTTPSTQSGRQDRRRRRCPPGVLQVPGRAWVHLRTTNPIESTLPPSVGAGVPEQPLGHGDRQLAMASYNLAMSPGDTCCGQLLRRLRSGLAMPCSSDHSAWWVAK